MAYYDFLAQMFAPPSQFGAAAGMDGLLSDPSFKQHIASQGLLSLGSSLLKAAGPSPRRTNLAAAFGEGMQNAQQAGQQALGTMLQMKRLGLDTKKLEAEVAGMDAKNKAIAIMGQTPPANFPGTPELWTATLQSMPEVAAKYYSPAEWEKLDYQVGMKKVSELFNPQDGTRIPLGEGPAFAPQQPRAPTELETLKSWLQGDDPQLKALAEQKLSGKADDAQGREIARLVGLGVPPDVATKVAAGAAQLSTPDQFGNISVVDLTTGKPISSFNMATEVGNQTTSTAAPAAAAAPTPAAPSLQGAAQDATGFGAQARKLVSNTIGQLFSGSIAPDTTTATQTINLFNQNARQAMAKGIDSGNISVQEQEWVNRNLVNPDAWFTDPDVEAQKVPAMAAFFQQKIGQIDEQLKQPTITKEMRGKLSDMKTSFNMLLRDLRATGFEVNGQPVTPTATKTVNGVTYFQHNGDWYAQ